MKIRISIIFVISCVVFANTSLAEVIFEENFNNQLNWQPRAATNAVAGSIVCSVPGSSCTPTPPSNWTFYRTTGLWWGPTYQDTIRITNQIDHGGGGKSFIVYNESNNGASGDGWGADGQLSKLLNMNYPELFIRTWIYYQSGWKWPSVSDMSIKTLRIDHYDGTGDFFANFSGGNNAPIAIYNFKHSNTYGTRALFSLRCEPKATNYTCSPGYDSDAYYLPTQGATPDPNSPGEPADGSWHRIDLHVKMNSYSGGTFNSDGVYELSYDGKLLKSMTNVRWLAPGSDSSIGWNSVSLGGNAYNLFSDPVNKSEQWYAIDDVVVSTTPIPADYVIGGPKPLAAPKNAVGVPLKP